MGVEREKRISFEFRVWGLGCERKEGRKGYIKGKKGNKKGLWKCVYLCVRCNVI